MPNPLALPWNQIIPLLPVDDQVANVDAETWEPHLTKAQYAADGTPAQVEMLLL